MPCFASIKHLLRNSNNIGQWSVSACKQRVFWSRSAIAATANTTNLGGSPVFTGTYGLLRTCFALPRFASRSYRKVNTFSSGQSTARQPHARDVATAAPSNSSAGQAEARASLAGERSKKIVGLWLLGCAGTALGTVLLGGVSRLAGSTLSMAEWRWNPLADSLLPRTQQEWESKFRAYQAVPEYGYKSGEKEGGLTMEDFKAMYRLEWAHRTCARAMALVFFLPGFVLLAKGWVPRGLKPRLVMHAGSLGFQSWLAHKAVLSGKREPPGLYDVPRMSSCWVSAHLLSTLSLYAMFLWQALAHLHVPQPLARAYRHRRTFMVLSHAIMALTVFTAVSGAVVSSIDAGLVYNSWPKMVDRWIPEDLWALGESKWKNAFENTTTAQFLHRCLAHTTVTLAAIFWLLTRRAPMPLRARLAVRCMLGAALLQLGLGVATLLTFVHRHVAATHQGGSMLLLTAAIWAANELRRIPK